MLTFREFLLEGQGEVSLTRKIEKNLSRDLLQALSDWEHINWSNGRLEKSFKSKDSLYQELTDSFEPVRDYLRKTQGNEITLYRGFGSKGEKIEGRILFSWTSRPKYASVFAQISYAKSGVITKIGTKGVYSSFRNLSDSDIQKAYDSLKTKGYAKLGNMSFKTWAEDKNFFITYIGTREETFGEPTADFVKWVTSRRQDLIDAEKEAEKSGTVVSQKIPVEDIMWISSGGRDSPGGVSMEYLVANHDGSRGKKVDVFEKNVKRISLQS